MKKLICVALLCLITVAFVGCNEIKETNASVSESAAEKQNDNSSDESSEEELRPRDREINTDTDFVFDDAGVLSADELENLNTYTAWLAKTFKINAAVVITDNIGDKEPDKYAEEYYNDLYSGDGILFLLNNDTNTDYIYRKGFPSKFIADDDIEMLFAEISPLLVKGDYMSAAKRVLETAELKLPEYITDKSGMLSKEEISELNGKLKDAVGENGLNVYLVNDTGEQSIEDYANEKFNDYYAVSSSSNAMLVINTANGDCFVCTSGSMEYLSDSQEDIQKAVRSCIKESDGKKTLDCMSAVDKLLTFIQ